MFFSYYIFSTNPFRLVLILELENIFKDIYFLSYTIIQKDNLFIDTPKELPEI